MAPPTPSKSTNHTKPSHDPLKGNSLIANKSITPGEVILEIPNPLLSLLDNAALDKYCYECFTLGRPWNPTIEEYEDDEEGFDGLEESRNEKLVSCRDCKRVRWCEGCSGNHVRSRRNVGKGRHDAECLILQRVAKEKGSVRFPTGMRQAAHVLKRYEEGYLPHTLPGVGEAEKSLWEGKSVRQVVEGMINWQKEQERGPGKEELELQTRAVVKYSGSEINVENVEVAKTLLCTMNVNTYRISTSSSQHIGLCFDPYLSLINHSCVPNAYISFRGPAAVVRALLPIEEGEEVLVSYIDQSLPRQQRHEKLKSRWHFECACEACEDKDWTAYTKFLRHATRPPGGISVCGTEHWRLLESLADTSACSSTSRVGVSVLPEDEHFRTPHENWESLTSAISQQPISITTQTAALHPFPQLLTSLQELYTRVGQYEVAFLLQLCQVYWIDPLLHPGPYTPDKLYSLDRLARLLDLRYYDMGFDLHKLKSRHTSLSFDSSVEKFNKMKYARPLGLLHQKLRCWAEKTLGKEDDFYRALVEKEEDRMLALRMEGGPGQGGEDEVWGVLAELGRVEVIWEVVRSVDLKGGRR